MSEVLDFTLADSFRTNHQDIMLSLGSLEACFDVHKLPTLTNWGILKEDLRREMQDIQLSFKTANQLDARAIHLQIAAIKAYEAGCP